MSSFVTANQQIFWYDINLVFRTMVRAEECVGEGMGVSWVSFLKEKKISIISNPINYFKDLDFWTGFGGENPAYSLQLN